MVLIGVEKGPFKEGMAFGEGQQGWWWALGGEVRWEGAQIPGTRTTRHPLQVYVKVSVPKGIRFVGHPGKRHLTKKMCVAPGEMEPTWLVLSFSDLGLINITGEGPMLR